MTNISFLKNIVEASGKKVALEHEVISAFESSGKIIVLFDPDAHIPKFGQFNNLIALNYNLERLWEAELPTNKTGDCYYSLISKDPLIALSYESYTCEVDINTGRIVNKEFTK